MVMNIDIQLRMEIFSWVCDTGINLVISMVLSGMSLLSTVCVLTLYHHSPDSPLPPWLRSLVFNYLPHLLCMARPENTIQPNIVHPATTEEVQDKLAFGTHANDVMGSNLRVNLPQTNKRQDDSSEFLRPQRNEGDKKKKVKAEWKEAARVFDRLFLIGYGVVTVISCVMVIALCILKPFESRHKAAVELFDYKN